MTGRGSRIACCEVGGSQCAMNLSLRICMFAKKSFAAFDCGRGMVLLNGKFNPACHFSCGRRAHQIRESLSLRIASHQPQRCG